MDTPDRYTDAYLADNELRQSDVVTVSAKKAAKAARDAAKHRAVYPHSLKTMFIDKVKKTVRPGQPEECHTFGATFNNAIRWTEGEIATLDVDNSKFSASTARSWISDWKSNPTGWLQKSRGPGDVGRHEKPLHGIDISKRHQARVGATILDRSQGEHRRQSPGTIRRTWLLGVLL